MGRNAAGEVRVLHATDDSYVRLLMTHISDESYISLMVTHLADFYLALRFIRYSSGTYS